MKQKIIVQIQAAVASLLLLAACSEDAADALQDAGNRIPLMIQVCSEEFSSPGGASTRAADVAFTTVFQDGDRLGIVATQPDGSKQNLCATYNGATKAWEGIYYDPKVTYLTAYFPYREELTNQLGSISDAAGAVSALKTIMPPSSDQSSREAYRASDLLTGTCLSTPATGGKSLDITLSHAYSLLVLQAGTEYTTTDGYTYRSPLRDVQASVGDALNCIPYASAEGYRLIADLGSSSSSVEWFYTSLAGTTYKVESSSSLSAGTYHLYRNITSTKERNLAVGDFYYSDGGIIPGNTQNPPSEGCIGVVFWVGNIATDNDDPLLKTKHPSCTHGLVVALQDASTGWLLWSSDYEDITQNWLSSQGLIYGITTLKEENKMQGYANTKALEGYNSSDNATGGNSGRTVLPIGLIKSYAESHPASANSSGWYWPSVKELKYMCWGQSASSGTAGREQLNQQFQKVTGATSLRSDGYWSSTEYDNYDYGSAWYVDFYYGDVSYLADKSSSSYYLRAVLAF